MSIATATAGPHLAADEECELARRWQEHDDFAARDRLVLKNTGLACKLAWEHKGRGLDLEDLDQAAYLGLMDACDSFDARRGRFTTHAANHIKKRIRFAMMTEGRLIRVPTYLYWGAMRVLKGLPPTSPVNAGHLESALAVFRPIVHDDEGDPESNAHGNHHLAWIEDDHPEEVDLDREDDIVRARELVDQLHEREAFVIRARFGLDGSEGGAEPKTLREIGRELNLTRERVRQIEVEALERMAELASKPREIA